MKRVKVFPYELNALSNLAGEAKMYWFDDEYVDRKTVDVQDLEDLSTACQNFILGRADINDLYDAIKVFERANISNKDVARAKRYIDKHADRFIP